MIVDELVKTNEMKPRKGDMAILKSEHKCNFYPKGDSNWKKKVIKKWRMVQQNPNGETQFSL